MYLHLVTPEAYRTPHHWVCARLYCRLLDDLLEPEAYFARLASTSYSLSCSETGLVLHFQVGRRSVDWSATGDAQRHILIGDFPVGNRRKLAVFLVAVPLTFFNLLALFLPPSPRMGPGLQQRRDPPGGGGDGGHGPRHDGGQPRAQQV